MFDRQQSMNNKMPRILLTEEEKRTSRLAACKRWREKHREQYNEIMRPVTRRFYNKNKDVLSKKCLARYFYNKEAERFRNILL